MPKFSSSSRSRLETCDPRLQALFNAVVKVNDCTILEGLRTLERQQELYRQGKSKLDGVNKKSKHQSDDGVSRAVDVAPYPIDWNTHRPEVAKRWLDFARAVLAEADRQGITVRWGGDWDGDWDRTSDPTLDQSFNDWPHWELR